MKYICGILAVCVALFIVQTIGVDAAAPAPPDPGQGGWIYHNVYKTDIHGNWYLHSHESEWDPFANNSWAGQEYYTVDYDEDGNAVAEKLAGVEVYAIIDLEWFLVFEHWF